MRIRPARTHRGAAFALLRRRTSVGVALGLLAAVLVPGRAHAQWVPPTGPGVLHGTVSYVGSAIPFGRTRVCLRLSASGERRVIHSRCVRVDDDGSYRIDSLPTWPLPAWVSCERLRDLGGSLAQDTIRIAADTPTRRDWAISTEGCDPRPRRRERRMFSGHYSYGFEESRFVPCPADDWIIPSDTLSVIPRTDAWVTWADSVAQGVVWPEPQGEEHYRRVFVRLRGTVEGPGHYGHLGVSPFELVVDSVAIVRRPGPDDCPT